MLRLDGFFTRKIEHSRAGGPSRASRIARHSSGRAEFNDVAAKRLIELHDEEHRGGDGNQQQPHLHRDGLNLKDISKPWHEGSPDMDRLGPDHRTHQRASCC